MDEIIYSAALPVVVRYNKYIIG